MIEPDIQAISEIVDELFLLFHETMAFHSDEQVRAALKDACAWLRKIRRRLQLVTQGYVVAVVGLTNVGKSTLLNALLGGDLAPRRNGPCTAAPIEFTYGEFLQLTVHIENSVRKQRWQLDSCEELHQRLAALASENPEGSSQSVVKVVVQVPVPLLANGLVIADTPGFGAAQTASETSTHEEALKRYLQSNVAQVFWVVLAEQGIGKREKDFYETYLTDRCEDVVVTGCEDWEPHERERFRRRFSRMLSSSISPRFHFVSGLQGLRGRETNSPELLEAAGIPLLEQRIRELSETVGRIGAIEAGLCQLLDDVRCWLQEYRNPRGFKLSPWWRPDSWSRWTACLPSHRLKNNLLSKLEPSN
ncbi:dynamin family protein [Thermopirellula anaerolimosa]